jgi:hypothetical protein
MVITFGVGSHVFIHSTESDLDGQEVQILGVLGSSEYRERALTIGDVVFVKLPEIPANVCRNFVIAMPVACLEERM